MSAPRSRGRGSSFEAGRTEVRRPGGPEPVVESGPGNHALDALEPAIVLDGDPPLLADVPPDSVDVEGGFGGTGIHLDRLRAVAGREPTAAERHGLERFALARQGPRGGIRRTSGGLSDHSRGRDSVARQHHGAATPDKSRGRDQGSTRSKSETRETGMNPAGTILTHREDRSSEWVTIRIHSHSHPPIRTRIKHD